jgi:hypothetical protein
LKNAVFWDIKTPISQETHYVSAIEPSRLILYKILGFHGGDYKNTVFLGCVGVWMSLEATFKRNESPTSSE